MFSVRNYMHKTYDNFKEDENLIDCLSKCFLLKIMALNTGKVNFESSKYKEILKIARA